MGGMKQPETVWVNPDWSKAKVSLATENMRCFGLGCPSQLIQPGDLYTRHRVKASGVYADREFCIECHPVRAMPAGFDCYTHWRETMSQYDREWLDIYDKTHPV